LGVPTTRLDLGGQVVLLLGMLMLVQTAARRWPWKRDGSVDGRSATIRADTAGIRQ
jgi:hypothetical protein